MSDRLSATEEHHTKYDAMNAELGVKITGDDNGKWRGYTKAEWATAYAADPALNNVRNLRWWDQVAGHLVGRHVAGMRRGRRVTLGEAVCCMKYAVRTWLLTDEDVTE